MRQKQLGMRGETVSAIGAGTGGLGGVDRPDMSRDTEVVEALRHALDLGMTLIDTAEVYGAGHSEELVGQAVKGRRDQVVLASKVSPEHLAPADLRASVEGSLRRLGVEAIDLFQIHWSNPAIPLADTLGAMEDLVSAGKIRHIGVCNFSLAELDEARSILTRVPLSSLQSEYNLFDRTAEDHLLPYCQQHGITFLAYSPLDQGQICGGPNRRAQLAPIADQYRCSIGTLALAWLTACAPVVAIPRTGKAEHCVENAAAGNLSIHPTHMAEIERITSVSQAVVPVDCILPVPTSAAHDLRAYRTLDDALNNTLNFAPSPRELAEQMAGGEFLKPIRVRPTDAMGYRYELVEGRLRYWAWIIAHAGKRDIPVLIRE